MRAPAIYHPRYWELGPAILREPVGVTPRVEASLRHPWLALLTIWLLSPNA